MYLEISCFVFLEEREANQNHFKDQEDSSKNSTWFTCQVSLKFPGKHCIRIDNHTYTLTTSIEKEIHTLPCNTSSGVESKTKRMSVFSYFLNSSSSKSAWNIKSVI